MQSLKKEPELQARRGSFPVIDARPAACTGLTIAVRESSVTMPVAPHWGLMPDVAPENDLHAAEAVALIRREFSDGLSARVQIMQSALEGLVKVFDLDLAERFFLQAHSLKGTAGTFGADSLVERAASLERIGSRWMKDREVTPAEISDASKELDRLKSAVADWAGGEP